MVIEVNQKGKENVFMAILIFWGAGYIDRHTFMYLNQIDEEVIVLDNLQKGH